MSNLEDDPFFDDRIVKAVTRCIHGQENLRIISPAELKVIQNGSRIRTLNDDLDGQLLNILREYQKNIPVRDQLEILLDGNDLNILDQILDLFQTVQVLELHTNLDTLYDALEESKKEGISPNWILAAMIDNVEEDSDKQAHEPGSSFSLGSL